MKHDEVEMDTNEAHEIHGRIPGGRVGIEVEHSIAGERFDDPPPGLDVTNWGALFALLYHHNYAGGVSYEPHSRLWNEDRYVKGCPPNNLDIVQAIIGDRAKAERHWE